MADEKCFEGWGIHLLKRRFTPVLLRNEKRGAFRGVLAGLFQYSVGTIFLKRDVHYLPHLPVHPIEHYRCKHLPAKECSTKRDYNSLKYEPRYAFTVLKFKFKFENLFLPIVIIFGNITGCR